MLYRLDYCDTDGRATGAVKGRDIGILPTGDVLTRHMTTARQRAIQAAAPTAYAPDGRRVLITRIDRAGRLRPSLVIRPDGSATTPPGMASTRDTCRAVGRPGTPTDDGGACFCSACRAARKGGR